MRTRSWRGFDGRSLDPEVTQAAKLVATVVGQDLEQREDGMFHIARRVAVDRVISTVDPEARPGHKTAARLRRIQGDNAIDPDSEIITATEVTPGNASDGSVANILLADVLKPTPSNESPAALVPISSDVDETATSSVETAGNCLTRVEIYGDASYGTTEIVDKIEGRWR